MSKIMKQEAQHEKTTKQIVPFFSQMSRTFQQNPIQIGAKAMNKHV